jgi:hypothetical protein
MWLWAAVLLSRVLLLTSLTGTVAMLAVRNGQWVLWILKKVLVLREGLFKCNDGGGLGARVVVFGCLELEVLGVTEVREPLAPRAQQGCSGCSLHFEQPACRPRVPTSAPLTTIMAASFLH